MRDHFKKWLLDIQENALAIKRAKALEAGDESLWKKEKWLSPQKNTDIKAKFRDEGEKLGYRSLPSYKTGAGEWLYSGLFIGAPIWHLSPITDGAGSQELDQAA